MMLRTLFLCLASLALASAWTIADDRASTRLAPASGSLAHRSHGWASMPVGENDEAILVHIPPRDTASSGAPAVESLRIRHARLLRQRPTHLAADPDGVTMVFERPRPNTRAQLLRMPISDSGSGWSYPKGRLQTLPSAPVAGPVVGACRSPGAMILLIRAVGENDEPGALTLWALERQSWEPLALPLDLPEPSDRPMALLGTGDGFAIIARVDDGFAIWHSDLSDATPLEDADSEAVPTPQADAPQATPDVAPQETARSVDPVTGDDLRQIAWTTDRFNAGPDLAEATPLAMLQQRLLVYTISPDGGVGVSSLGRSGEPISLATIPGVDDPGADASANRVVALAPMGSSQRVAMLRSAGEPARRSTEVIEFSMISGEQFARGPAVVAGPLSAQEVRILALVILLIAATTITIAMAPEKDPKNSVVPEGFALAEPSRRMGASLVDLIVAAVITGQLLGIGASEALAISALQQDSGGHFGLLVTLGVGLVMSVVCETLFGKTPGKMLLGTRVVRALPMGGNPSFVGALARNAVKWVLPPLAFMQILKPASRHRGETIAGTWVVSPRRDEPGAPVRRPPPSDREPAIESQSGPDTQNPPDRDPPRTGDRAETADDLSSSDPPSDR